MTIDVVVCPDADVWIVGWMYALAPRRVQYPELFVAAGQEITLRASSTLMPTAALVRRPGQDGPPNLMAIGFSANAADPEPDASLPTCMRCGFVVCSCMLSLR